MSIVNTLALESNRQIKINFNGDDLSLLFTPQLVIKQPIMYSLQCSITVNTLPVIFN